MSTHTIFHFFLVLGLLVVSQHGSLDAANVAFKPALSHNVAFVSSVVVSLFGASIKSRWLFVIILLKCCFDKNQMILISFVGANLNKTN